MNLHEEIDKIFARWGNGTCPGGQVLVRQNGEIIHNRCFGYANLEHEIPVEVDTRFHVASVSKQVTVLCILLLQEEGKLSVDHDIRAYVSDLVAFDETVTIRNLMNNTSGIRDQWELLMLSGVRLTDSITMEDLRGIISRQKKLNFTPGSEYLYSNSNFTLLAEIVERLSGMSLPEFAAKRVFCPLGMAHSQIRTGSFELVPKLAYSYVDEGDGKFCPQAINFCLYGATSLNTTAQDLMRLRDNYSNHTICSRETVEQMMYRPILANGKESEYGGGLMRGEYRGISYFEHGGVDAGYRAQLLCLQEEGVDIAILSNTTNTSLSLASRKIADLVLSLPKVKTMSIARESSKAFEPQGDYCHAGKGDALHFKIKQKEGGLYLQREFSDLLLNREESGIYRLGYLEEAIAFLPGKIVYDNGRNRTNLMKTTAATADDGRELLGKYQCREIDSALYIEAVEGLLMLSHSRQGKSPLFCLEIDRYTVDVGRDLLAFLRVLRGEGGAVSGFMLDSSRSWRMEYKKQ